MKRFPLFLSLSVLSLTLTSTTGCPADDAGDDIGDDTSDSADTGNGMVIEVGEDINEDTVWTADNTYVLTALVFVNNATLTIEAGTTIRGTSGSALVIVKDAMLMSHGTADAPVVFTSNNVDNPTSGDWGGVVLLGEGIINLEGGQGQAEGFPVPPTYGGNNAAHNCGMLEYTRVEYAGFAISDGNELNGITFYACGSATTAHHVQSHMGLDDGIEFFGGGFDLDHIVVTGANDDSLDVDQGFTGTFQHIFIQQNPTVGDSCFEVSNQGTDFTAEPRTSPTICNATCIGSGDGGEKSKGIIVKEGTHGSWQANIFTNATNEAALLADDATGAEVLAGTITVENNIFFANLGDPQFKSGATDPDSAGWAAWIEDAARANLSSDPGLGSIAWGSPNAMPSGDVAGNGSGCGGTSYVGAVDPAGEDWTAASWINYEP